MGSGKVTIIVPVYNGEKRIRECLNSIVSQTYANLQVVVIDDGSSDHTLAICKEFQQHDNRIQVIEIANRGVSHARNIGIEEALGEYIQFVDGDDTIKKNATELLVHHLERNHSDLAVCGYVKLLKEIKVPFNQLEWPGIYTNQEYLIHTLKDPGHHYYGVVWNKIYRRKIISDYNIRFTEDTNLGEDFIFNLSYLQHTKQVQVMRNSLYLYNCRDGITLSRYDKTIQKCREELLNRHVIYERYQDAFKYLGLYDQWENQVKQYWLIYYTVNLYYIKHMFRNWDQEELQAWVKELHEDKDVAACLLLVSEYAIKRKVARTTFERFCAIKLKRIFRVIKRIE